jgi:hypothetical protein
MFIIRIHIGRVEAFVIKIPVLKEYTRKVSESMGV